MPAPPRRQSELRHWRHWGRGRGEFTSSTSLPPTRAPPRRSQVSRCQVAKSPSNHTPNAGSEKPSNLVGGRHLAPYCGQYIRTHSATGAACDTTTGSSKAHRGHQQTSPPPGACTWRARGRPSGCDTEAVMRTAIPPAFDEAHRSPRLCNPRGLRSATVVLSKLKQAAAKLPCEACNKPPPVLPGNPLCARFFRGATRMFAGACNTFDSMVVLEARAGMAANWTLPHFRYR